MCEKEIRRINSSIMYLGICIMREFWIMIAVHVPEMERSEEERYKFWEKLKGCIEVFED